MNEKSESGEFDCADVTKIIKVNESKVNQESLTALFFAFMR